MTWNGTKPNGNVTAKAGHSPMCGGGTLRKKRLYGLHIRRKFGAKNTKWIQLNGMIGDREAMSRTHQNMLYNYSTGMYPGWECQLRPVPTILSA